MTARWGHLTLVAIGAVVWIVAGTMQFDSWVERLAPRGPEFYEVECARTCDAIRADAVAGTAFGCVCERAGTERFIIGRAWAP